MAKNVILFSKISKDGTVMNNVNKTEILRMVNDMLHISSTLKNILCEQNVMSYHAWATQWLNVYKKPHVSKSQFYSLNVCFKKHLSDDFKSMPLANIDSTTIEQELYSIGSTKMRQLTYDLLSGSFKKAVELGKLFANPVSNVKKPKHIQNVGTPLSANEIHTLLARSTPRLAYFFKFILLTGARRSEAINVKWSDVDFNNSFVHIRGTKTEKADRIIPLFAELREMLLCLPKTNESIFDFDAGYTTRRFNQILPSHRLHDLRHTFATRCAECSISDDVVQNWLGHSRNVTTKRYTHIRQARKQIEAQKFHLFD